MVLSPLLGFFAVYCYCLLDMSESSYSPSGQSSSPSGVPMNIIELGLAIFLFFLGCLVMYDSYRLGNAWGDDGPQSGYFPFYVGVLLSLSALGIIVQTILFWYRNQKDLFAEYGQLRLVGAVFIPTAVYICLLSNFGFYIWSSVFIAWFMKTLGKYSWTKTILIPLTIALVSYLMFDIAFDVPLPKGPIEDILIEAYNSFWI